MTTSVYCDETGNTGLSFLDPEQPVFILGGVLDTGDGRIETALRAVKQNLSNRLDVLINERAVLFIQVAFKPYDLVTLFFDHFFDPSINAQYPEILYANWNAREQVLEILFTLFWETGLLPSVEGLLVRNEEELLEPTAEELRKAIEKRLSRDEAKQMLYDSLDFVLAHRNLFFESPIEPRLLAPNFHMFCALLGQIHDYAEAHSISTVNVFHDNQKEFAADLERGYHLLKGSGRAGVEWGGGARMSLPVGSIAKFEFVDSKDESCVRLVDDVLGLLNAWLTSAYHGKTLRAKLQSSLPRLFAVLRSNRDRLFAIANKNFAQHLFSPVL